MQIFYKTLDSSVGVHGNSLSWILGRIYCVLIEYLSQEAMTEAMQVLETPEATTPAEPEVTKKRKIDDVIEEKSEEKAVESEEPTKKKKKKKRKSEAVAETTPGKKPMIMQIAVLGHSVGE